MHVLHIVVGGKGLYGHYGKGTTLAEAQAAYKKAGGKKRDKQIVHRFESELPFAPFDRDATDEEADAWVGRDGSINWLRCQRTAVGEPVT